MFHIFPADGKMSKIKFQIFPGFQTNKMQLGQYNIFVNICTLVPLVETKNSNHTPNQTVFSRDTQFQVSSNDGSSQSEFAPSTLPPPSVMHFDGSVSLAEPSLSTPANTKNVKNARELCV